MTLGYIKDNWKGWSVAGVDFNLQDAYQAIVFLRPVLSVVGLENPSAVCEGVGTAAAESEPAMDDATEEPAAPTGARRPQRSEGMLARNGQGMDSEPT